MKRIILLLICLVWIGNIYAEEIIQVAPFQTTAGVTYSAKNRKGFSVNMNNGAIRPRALEFEFILPEGLTVATNSAGTIFRMSDLSDRFLYYDEEEEDYVNYYTASCSLTNGVYKMLIVYGLETPDDCAIEGNSGEIITLYYTTSSDMEDGVYPIYVQNAKISYEDGSKGYLPNSSSYVVIGESSPLKTEENVDLGFLTGYVPSFVVDALSDDLSENENLSMVNLSGVENLGGELSLAENQLWFTSNEASLNREFPANQWCTVCLPFALSNEMVTGLNENGVEVEKLTEYDEVANEVYFSAVDEMEANVPYAIRCATAMTPFKDLSGINVTETPIARSVELGRVSMQGTYKTMVLNSDSETTYYAFNAADGEFVRIGKNAKTAPFRAFLTLTGASSAKNIKVLHGDDFSTSIVNPMISTDDHSVYDLQGRKVNGQLMKGIYIVNGQKLVKP